MMALLIVGVPVLLLFIWFIATYNRFVQLRNHCTEAWSNIDTELKRRYELIPNLVATVKGYAAHERGLLEEVTRLRAACAQNNGPVGEQATSERALVAALGKVFVLAERYPELKASANFLALQEELTNTEDRLQAARRFFNGNVRENNNLVESFPSNLVANMFSFTLRDFFEVEPAVRGAEVRVDFGKGE
jgi:LemA protein